MPIRFYEIMGCQMKTKCIFSFIFFSFQENAQAANVTMQNLKQVFSAQDRTQSSDKKELGE